MLHALAIYKGALKNSQPDQEAPSSLDSDVWSGLGELDWEINCAFEIFSTLM